MTDQDDAIRKALEPHLDGIVRATVGLPSGPMSLDFTRVSDLDDDEVLGS